jgi:rhodanese-related sulfurtransferase
VSVSGAELLKRVKEQIREVDPSEVSQLLGEGVVVVDCRETEELAGGMIPGALHIPRSYLETRIEATVPDRSQRIILYCASGVRSAFGAHTLMTEMGYDDVESMTGGFTLWKDRGYEVDVPRSLQPSPSRARSGTGGPAEAA